MYNFVAPAEVSLGPIRVTFQFLISSSLKRETVIPQFILGFILKFLNSFDILSKELYETSLKNIHNIAL